VGPAPDLVRELSTESAVKIFSYNLPLIILFRNTTLPESRNFEAELRAAHPEIAQRLLVLQADINSSIGQKIAGLVGLDTETDSFPRIRILDPNPGKSSVVKYDYNKPSITKDNIIAFVSDFTAGNIKPYQKSEKAPQSPSPYVAALNSETFEKLKEDKTIELFVLFIGKRCKLCGEFFPAFDNAARYFSKNKNLVFATIDMSRNEVADDSVFYYPTVKFYALENKKRGWDYDKGIQVQQVIDFVKKVTD